MSDGARRRNVEPTPQGSAATTSADTVTSVPVTRSRRTAPKAKQEDETVEEEEIILAPQPVLWKFSTWPSHVKRWPLYALIVYGSVFLYNQYTASLSADNGLDTSSFKRCSETFNYSFPINKAAFHAQEVDRTLDWQVAIAAEARIELISPERSVFSSDPFPEGKIPSAGRWAIDPAVGWPDRKMGTLTSTLSLNFTNPNAAEPAALGVPAIMLSKFPGKGDFLKAATRQVQFLRNETFVPRWANGAISYSVGEPALLRAETISFVAPFFAYYGVTMDDVEMVRESVRQVELHREVLRVESGKLKGLWRHQAAVDGDGRAWSVGNAWAAHGMARVRATVSKWGATNETMKAEIGRLDNYIKEILDAVIATDKDLSRLVRNFIGDKSSFGEVSGTALLASAAYRMAVLDPERFAIPKYLDWAHTKRRVVAASLDEETGHAQPVVNPYDPYQKEPQLPGTAMAGSFVVMMAAAWKDCVCLGVCLPESGTKMRVIGS